MLPTTIDPILQAAIEEHRLQINKPVREPGRTSTFFMFHSARLNENYRDMQDGPRIGFSAETLARLLTLFPLWDSAKRILAMSDLAGRSRLVPVGVFTDEMIFDEASQRIYSARLQIEFGGGVSVPMRDSESGSQMRPNGQVTAHEIHRHSIEAWRSMEQVTIGRGLACGQVAAAA